MKSKLIRLFSTLVLSNVALAQGRTEYCNFESPQVKPIAVAKVQKVLSGTKTYLLVCNTPDNTVEVYDIQGSNRDSPSFVTRIPVGLEPVSVVFARIMNKDMMYTVNWLGDSVTYVELSHKLVGSGMQLQDVFDYKVTHEVRVTDPTGFQDAGGKYQRGDDEPMHLAVVDRSGGIGQFLVVSKATASSYSVLHPTSGAFLEVQTNTGSCTSGGTGAEGGRNVLMHFPVTLSDDPPPTVATSDNNGMTPLGLTSAAISASLATVALKEPRTVAVRTNSDEFWVLGHHGGGSKSAPHGNGTTDLDLFDFDAWGVKFNDLVCDSTNTRPTFFFLSGLGTTNFNMAFNNPTGTASTALYIVGIDSQDDVVGNGNLLSNDSTETGFVKTMLYRVDTSSGEILRRDLNRQSHTGGAGDPIDSETPSLSHVTDLAVYKHPSAGRDFICVVGFNSGGFGIVDISGTTSGDEHAWPISRVAIPASDDDYIPGPRGVAVLESGSATNDRVYVLNTLDEPLQTVQIIKPNGGGTAGNAELGNSFTLSRSPVPDYVKAGRKFLYATAGTLPGHTSDTNTARFNSCASCHVDARSDQQQWRLTTKHTIPDGGPDGFQILPHLPDPTDAFEDETLDDNRNEIADIDLAAIVDTEDITDGYPNDGDDPADDANKKGPMITQSLQGLVNYEIGGNLFDGIDENNSDDLISNAPYHWRGDKATFKHFNEAFVGLMGMTESSGSEPQGGLTTTEMADFEQFINSIHYPPNPLQPRDRHYSGDDWEDPDDIESGATGAKLGLQVFHTEPLQLFGNRSCVQCHFLPEGSNNRLTFHDEHANGLDPNNNDSDRRQPTESAALRGLTQKEGRLELSAVSDEEETGRTPLMRTGDLGTGHEGMEGLSRNEFVVRLGDTFTPTVAYLREFDNGVAPIVGQSFQVDQGGTTPTDDLDEIEEQAKSANCGIAVYGRLKISSAFVERGFWYKFSGNDESSGTEVYKEVNSSSTYSRTSLLALLNESGEFLIWRATPLGSERRVASFAQSSSDSPGTGDPSNVEIVGTAPNDGNEIITELSKNWDAGTGDEDFNWLATTDPEPPLLPLPEPLSLRATRALQGAVFTPLSLALRHDAPRRLQVVGDNLLHGAQIQVTLASGEVLELPIYPTAAYTDERRIWETAAEFDPMALYTMMLGGPEDTIVRKIMTDETLGVGEALTIQDVTVKGKNVASSGWSSGTSQEIPYPEVP